MGEAGKAAGRTGAPGLEGPEARTAAANEVQLRPVATAADRKKATRLRSWGETSEASAHIIVLRIAPATAIQQMGRAFHNVKPAANPVNL